jgi:hypothetical protein
MKIRHLIFAFVLPLFLASCVSKKKYRELNKQLEDKTSGKAVLEDVLNKLAVENDSLKNMLVLMDSLLRMEREKNQSLAVSPTTKKDEVRSIKFKVKPNLISEKEEYDTKAVYIYNFISYIFWPSETLGESFNIGIVGDSPIKTYLQTRANGRDVNNVPIVIESYNPKKNYHILFFSKAGQANFNKIRKTLTSKTVLLITENSLFENIGSHLTLFVDGKKVKYTANKSELEKSKLKVNSSLYRLSE